MNLFKFLSDAIKMNSHKAEPPEKEMARVCVAFNGTEYSFVEKKLEDGVGIRMGVRIHSGPYRGVIFTTSPKISFTEQDDGTCRMNFDFTVEKLPANLPNETVKEDALRDTVGGIIQDIIARDWGNDPEEQQEEYADRGSNPIGAGE
jgi:hypothetical protein